MDNPYKPLIWAAAIASTLLTLSAGVGSADEIKVLSAVGMRQVLVELVPVFERTTGHHVRFVIMSVVPDGPQTRNGVFRPCAPHPVR